MNPNNFYHYDIYFQDDAHRYMRGFEAYEQFIALNNQEAGGSGSGLKKKMTYIPRQREEAEQRLLDDYFGDEDTPPKYSEENFRRRVPGANKDLNVLYGSSLFDDVLVDRAPEAPFLVNGETYNKSYYFADGIREEQRKIVVYGLGLIGCAPTEITRFGTDGKTCVESINNDVGLFNDRLKPVVDMLNSDFSDARFTFINLTIIQATQGGEVLPNVGCCQVRPSDGQCIPNSVPYPVRALSLWYDGFHPTEIVNTIFATRSYTTLSARHAQTG
ncbi:GDSL esterase/lipase-like protein [Tanacetum coccineum]